MIEEQFFASQIIEQIPATLTMFRVFLINLRKRKGKIVMGDNAFLVINTCVQYLLILVLGSSSGLPLRCAWLPSRICHHFLFSELATLHGYHRITVLHPGRFHTSIIQVRLCFPRIPLSEISFCVCNWRRFGASLQFSVAYVDNWIFFSIFRHIQVRLGFPRIPLTAPRILTKHILNTVCFIAVNVQTRCECPFYMHGGLLAGIMSQRSHTHA